MVKDRKVKSSEAFLSEFIQAAITKSTNWVLINNRNLLLRVLEPGNSRSGCQHDGVRALFQVTHFFLYPHVVERARELWNISFVKSLIPFIKVPLHDLVFQKPRLLTPLY